MLGFRLFGDVVDERSARRLRDVDVALLMRGALSPASQRTHVLENAVCVVNSLAPCFVSQDSLDSGGSALLEELVRRTATR